MRRWTTAALALSLSFAGTARADDVERSVALGRAGLELYAAGDWSGCAARFAEASGLAQSPVFLLYQGRCLRNGKELLTARDVLAKVTAFELPADAPSSWRQAKTDAGVELATLDASIPTIVVEVVGATASDLRLDGAKVRANEPIALNPGAHRVSGVAGGRTVEAAFDVVAGVKEKKVVLSFEAKVEPGVPPFRETGGTIAPMSEGSLVPGAVVTSIGGGALLVGAILGGVAAMQFSDIDERCAGDPETPATCRRSSAEVDGLQGELDDTNVIADAATGLLIGGGVVSAVGVVLLIVQPGGSVKADARGLTLRF